MSGDWRNLAACRGLDPGLFFAEHLRRQKEESGE